jgi:hypothetical protein
LMSPWVARYRVGKARKEGFCGNHHLNTYEGKWLD